MDIHQFKEKLDEQSKSWDNEPVDDLKDLAEEWLNKQDIHDYAVIVNDMPQETCLDFAIKLIPDSCFYYIMVSFKRV